MAELGAILTTANTEVAEVTAKLRWVPSHDIGPTMKLQQAWQVTYLDENSKPWRRDIVWRDVPTDMHPQS